MRAKNVQVEGVEAHRYNSAQRSSLEAYRSAREAGLQPQTTRKADVEKAWRLTDKTGTPFRADK